LFSALKTRGFNLESTHFRQAERLSKLVALLALGFCWAMLTGLWHHQHHPIAIKSHGRKPRVSSAMAATFFAASAAIWLYGLPNLTKCFNFCPRTEHHHSFS
jgi:hypothetical protein